jgi:hypothetical protein
MAALGLGAAGAGRLAADLADDVAQVSIEAAGGAKAHAALRSFKAEGVTVLGGKEVEFILYAARPRSVRIETLGEKTSLVRAYDGVHAPWKKDDPTKPPRRLGRQEEHDFLLESDFDQPLFDYEARKISLDYAGEAQVDGRPCLKLLATVRFADVMTLYIDDETHLLVRRDREERRGGKTIRLETHYSDFKKVAGVRLPRRIRTLADGVLLHETRIKDYDANPDLPADFFRPPVRDWPRD